MPRALYVVHSRPSSPEREDEYNKWYDEVHLPDICAVEGVTGAKRYVRQDDPDAPSDLPPYLAVYEFDHDDLQVPIAGIMAGVEDGSIAMTDAIELDPQPIIGLYVER